MSKNLWERQDKDVLNSKKAWYSQSQLPCEQEVNYMIDALAGEGRWLSPSQSEIETNLDFC